jgi:hypothetical protein
LEPRVLLERRRPNILSIHLNPTSTATNIVITFVIKEFTITAMNLLRNAPLINGIRSFRFSPFDDATINVPIVFHVINGNRRARNSNGISAKRMSLRLFIFGHSEMISQIIANTFPVRYANKNPDRRHTTKLDTSNAKDSVFRLWCKKRETLQINPDKRVNRNKTGKISIVKISSSKHNRALRSIPNTQRVGIGMLSDLTNPYDGTRKFTHLYSPNP